MILRPELLYDGAKFVAGDEVVVDDKGDVVEVRTARASEVRPEAHGSAAVVELAGKALLPGFVNAHSHAFQRLIRGKAETRAVSGRDFWSWRGTMYHAASRLDPQQVYDVSRMAFLEMLLTGTTTVGEFHYLHNAADGMPYEDPNVLARQVIAAASSVGIRIVLLRTAYLRSGFELAADPGQKRFFETAEAFLSNMGALRRDYPEVEIGVAPHSLRAVPLGELHAIAGWAREHGLPVHMHVAEQLGENEACVREYGLTPVALLAREKLLGADFTAVHATHTSDDEVASLAASGTTICACPTTERNLGDGIFRADAAMAGSIPVALGSDSQAQIDPLEDARQTGVPPPAARPETGAAGPWWPAKRSRAVVRLRNGARGTRAGACGVKRGRLLYGRSGRRFCCRRRRERPAAHGGLWPAAVGDPRRLGGRPEGRYRRAARAAAGNRGPLSRGPPRGLGLGGAKGHGTCAACKSELRQGYGFPCFANSWHPEHSKTKFCAVRGAAVAVAVALSLYLTRDCRSVLLRSSRSDF